VSEAANDEEKAEIALIPQGLGMPVKRVLEASQDDSFVPWLTLAQGSSDSVKRNNPEGVRAGDYILGGRKVLPREGVRVKALGVKETMIARPHATCDDPELESFIEDDEVWAQVEAARGRKDGSQARVGTDVLLWLPDEGSFTVFGFANTYAREMPDLVKAYLAGDVAVFKSRLVGKKNEWFVPAITHAKAAEGITVPSEKATRTAVEFFFAPVLAYRDQKPAAAAATSRPR
jgi:hypothetical protein